MFRGYCDPTTFGPARGLVALFVVGVAAILPAAGQQPDRTGIRAVDFYNFECPLDAVSDSRGVRLRDGSFLRESEDDRLYAAVRNVVYGDLTGDGSEEAVVLIHSNTGGTGQFSEGFVYTMRAGRPMLLGALAAGDRADGGIHDVAMRNGRLVVERYGRYEAGGACCPQFVETEELRLIGGTLVAAGRTTRRAYESYTRDDGSPQRVRFVKGSSTATLVGSTLGGERYVLGARAGQTLAIELVSDDANAFVVVSVRGGAAVGRAEPGFGWSGKLPGTGDYVIAIDSNAPAESEKTYYSVELAVR